MDIPLIIIIVIASLVAVFLLLLFMDLLFVSYFKKKLLNHEKALGIILDQKYSLINKVISLLEKYECEVPSTLISTFKGIDVEELKKVVGEESYNQRETLSFLKQSLVSIGFSDERLKKNEEFQFVYETLNSLDSQYHNFVASYNSEVLGFNYWVRFRPCRFVFLMADIKTKDSLN